jgi:cation:H+ antiporter
VLIDLLLFAVGLVGLYFGAEWLVGGAARLAEGLGVSSLLVGPTLVSLGTSAPELVVSGLASYRDNGGLAMGNVLGSNIANIALILGIAALIFPISVQRALLVRDLPIMIAAALLIPVFGWSGVISRPEGAILLALFVGYLLFIGIAARRESSEGLALMEAEGQARPGRREQWRDLGIAMAGLVVLSGGAHALVVSAVNIAGALGVSEVVIGLTMVAFGTSVPELAASISAARRGDPEIVIGNIIGSNIFNVLLILGGASMVRPLPVPASVLAGDALVVIVLSFALLPILYTGMRVSRIEGGVLLASYFAFIVWTAF